MDLPDPGGTSRSDTPARDRAAQLGVTIRPLVALSEFRACVALQDAVWGQEFSERVPVSLLKAATYVGGLVIGAFASDHTLAGFVFGLTGLHGTEIAHWSHLLAVRGAARNHGLGRLLKECQRAELAQRGIGEMFWTFDPLIAKNAHLNLNLLGARVVRFTPNMYGPTDSPLHHGLATDRLVVSQSTFPTRNSAAAPVFDDTRAPLLTLESAPGDELVDVDGTLPPLLRLEVPSDFEQLSATSPARAAEWHASVREHFLWSMNSGYEVCGLHRDAVTSRSFYVLATNTPPQT